MAREYEPEPGGSATYDHLAGKITHGEYRAYLDRQRAAYGFPPIHEATEIAERLAGSSPTLEETPDNAFLAGNISREKYHTDLSRERADTQDPQV